MIERFRIQNFKALRDVTVELTPFHVLIGPNDSGKSSILEALAAFCRSVDHRLPDAFTGLWEGHQLVWGGKRDLRVSLEASVRDQGAGQEQMFDYSFECSFVLSGRNAQIAAEAFNGADWSSVGTPFTMVYHIVQNGYLAPSEMQGSARRVADSLRGVQTYRWDARFLALPVAPDSKRRFRMEPNGFGLALCLDDILGFDRELFIRLEKRFQQIFPEIKSIKLLPEPAYKSPVDNPEQIPLLNKSDGKGIYFEFKAGGAPIPARQASDGLLLILAYLAVLHSPEPPRLLLVEEPENGIHPKRLQDVLSILRGLISEQSQTQVVLTTHSPYVVDLFTPEEVTLCRKQPDGSVGVLRLSQSQAVQEQLDVFTLGEIWTAEGDNDLAQPVKETAG